ncbi:MAG: hypothetical protein KatS3mg110_2405 [Pirellulaceae bacterium]|nr:MAG: hypothetical protein KatS3mg110_2405 [Pirellulaceae bacterium]
MERFRKVWHIVGRKWRGRRCGIWLARVVTVLCLGVYGLCGTEILSQDAATFSDQEIEFFEKHVRPILVEHCFECHSDKVDEPKGGLRLDSRQAILQGGDTGPAAVPGKPDESLLVDAINYGSLYQMPPKSKLPAQKIAVLRRWVEMGLPWPEQVANTVAGRTEDTFQERLEHWCWQPARPSSLPPVQDCSWVRDPLDQFILARLEAEGISPAPEADRLVWLRRVTFDLTGLPPSVEEIQHFLEDRSPDAYAKVVDRLLASPAFAERWARHWLDLVRYAESRGHEFDFDIPNAFEYRDYVIRALQVDLPYDQWVLEHVAGDLLEQPRRHPVYGWNESVLGTGFWYLGEWVHSPVDIRQDECDRMDNMLDVFSKTFLGLTVGCARCHDHKFDAITQRDYYALLGFLKSSTYRQVHFETYFHNREVAEQLAAWEVSMQERLDQELERVVGTQQRHWKAALVAAVEVFRAQLRAQADLTAEADRTSPSGGTVDNAEKVSSTLDGIDRACVDRFVSELQAGRRDAQHPWYWLSLAADLSARQPQRWQAALVDELQRAKAACQQRLAGWSSVAVVWQPGQESSQEWLAWCCDGFAYGLQPQRTGSWIVDEGPDGVCLAEYPAARFRSAWQQLKRSTQSAGEPGKLSAWDRAGKVVRTPTFVLGNEPLHYLVRGAGLAYVVVDSHRMINGPLHGSLLKEFRTQGSTPQWVTHDLTRYAGHEGHVEFYPLEGAPFEVLAVIQGSQPPEWPAAGWNDLVVEYLLQRTPGSLDELVGRFAGFLDWIAEPSDNLAPPGWTQAMVAGSVAAWRNAMLDRLPLADSNLTLRAALFADLERRYGDYQRLAGQIAATGRTAPAMWDGSGCDEWLLVRGNPRTPRERVPRRWLEALGGSQFPAPTSGSGRLELARHLIDPGHPLTARVYVNRIWHHLMGRGLVGSVDNFGILGDRPSHPELLDYLAKEFIELGWSTKAIIRRIVLSSTYRMDSGLLDATAQARDPANRLWHRMELKRLEGEALRDAMLAISGRLDTRMYGPSVPVYLTPFMQGRGRPGTSGPLDGDGRRSIYIAVRRNFLSPMMLAFDTPQPFSTVGRRAVSNVPAQALILMNDPFVVQQAARWADRLLSDHGPVDTPEKFSSCVRTAYLQTYGRPATDEEIDLAGRFFQEQGAIYGLNGNAAMGDRRIWADYCHALWNAKEFFFVR